MESGQGELVGSVSRLWRHPVKSMLGEELQSADVVWSGVFGNRCYALVDVESSRLVSAKNPAKWGRMFECSSRLAGGARGNEPGRMESGPAVQITLPDGATLVVEDGEFEEAERTLSNLLGRRVKFAAARKEPRVSTYEQYHAPMDGVRQGGRTTVNVRPLEAQAGTLTDVAAVHLITTATLQALSRLNTSADFDPLRFRPDLLAETGGSRGFVESAWVGRTLAVGDDVRLEVFKECGRCVMTTLPQGRLARDNSVLGTVLGFNRGKAGVYASVLRGGKVRKGDRISLV